MKEFHYQLVDVFTSQAFGGNQLAVFTEARGLTSQVMQQIAKGNRTPGGELYRAERGGEVSGKSEGAGSLRIAAVQAAVK
jgi:hypothetical protein